MTAPDTLNAALAVEHAAIYTYGVIGGQAASADKALARSGYDGHRAWRDRLSALITVAGGAPVTAKPAYELLVPVTGAASVRALAAALEDGCAVAYEQLVAAADDGGTRTTATAALVECATRATRWRLAAHDPAPARAFPGRG